MQWFEKLNFAATIFFVTKTQRLETFCSLHYLSLFVLVAKMIKEIQVEVSDTTMSNRITEAGFKNKIIIN